MALNFLSPPEPVTPPIPPISAPGSPTSAAGPTIGVVSQEDALSGSKHTEIPKVSLTDLSGASQGSAPIAGSSVQLGNLVQGKHAVELMDAMLPALFVLLFKYLKIDVGKKEFQLTEKEKNVIAPIMEACMNSIVLNFNSPWTTLAITVGVIYGSKAVEHGGVKFLDKKAAAGKTPADLKKDISERLDKQNEAMQQNKQSAAETLAKAPPIMGMYTADDIEKIGKKRKKGPKDAADWLEKNWVKMGGKLK